jgi:hypothetical protein
MDWSNRAVPMTDSRQLSDGREALPGGQSRSNLSFSLSIWQSPIELSSLWPVVSFATSSPIFEESNNGPIFGVHDTAAPTSCPAHNHHNENTHPWIHYTWTHTYIEP